MSFYDNIVNPFPTTCRFIYSLATEGATCDVPMPAGDTPSSYDAATAVVSFPAQSFDDPPVTTWVGNQETITTTTHEVTGGSVTEQTSWQVISEIDATVVLTEPAPFIANVSVQGIPAQGEVEIVSPGAPGGDGTCLIDFPNHDYLSGGGEWRPTHRSVAHRGDLERRHSRELFDAVLIDSDHRRLPVRLLRWDAVMAVSDKCTPRSCRSRLGARRECRQQTRSFGSLPQLEARNSRRGSARDLRR